MSDAKLTLQTAGAPIETIEPDWRDAAAGGDHQPDDRAAS